MSAASGRSFFIEIIAYIRDRVITEQLSVPEYRFEQIAAGNIASQIAVLVCKLTVFVTVNIAQTFLALLEAAFLGILEYRQFPAADFSVAGLDSTSESISCEWQQTAVLFDTVH